MSRKLKSLIIVGLLVGSVLSGIGPIGTAAAGNVSVDQPDSYDSTAADENSTEISEDISWIYQDDSANSTELHARSPTLETSNESELLESMTAVDAAYQARGDGPQRITGQTGAISHLIAERTIARMHSQGATTSEIETTAIENVNEYHRQQQLSTIDQWETTGHDILTLANASDSITGDTIEAVGTDQTDGSTVTMEIVGTAPVTHRLAVNDSGSYHEVESWGIQVTDGTNTETISASSPAVFNSGDIVVDRIRYTTSGGQSETIDLTAQLATWSQAENTAESVENDVPTLVTEMDAGFQNGTLNESTVQDRVNTTMDRGDISPSESQDRSADLNAIAFAPVFGQVADPTEVDSMTVSTTDWSKDGIIAANTLNDPIQNGSTYSPTGPTAVIGSTSFTPIMSDWTIESMTEDSESVESVNVTVVETTPLTESNIIQQMSDLESLEDQESVLLQSNTLFGGGSGFGGDSGMGLIIIGAAGAAIVLIGMSQE